MGNFVQVLFSVVCDALEDTAWVVPFLFLTYLLMEWIEHRTNERSQSALLQSGVAGPLAGAALGLIPQCGFSAAAATLWAGRVISLGTLCAVFLSTSDEMIPIFLAGGVPLGTIFGILGAKLLIGVVMGIAIDFLYRKTPFYVRSLRIETLCAQEHCHCHGEEGGIVKSAFIHTVQVTLFVFCVVLLMNFAFEVAGEAHIASFLASNSFFSLFASATLALVPNCAASVAIAQLYVEGVLSSGAMMAGLLVNAGLGLLVLFRTNRNVVQNICVVLLLYAAGIVWGMAIDAAGVVF